MLREDIKKVQKMPLIMLLKNTLVQPVNINMPNIIRFSDI